MEIRALVYSVNRFFLDSFSSYVMGCREVGIEFSFFSESDSAEKYLGRQRVDMILAERDFLEKESLPAKAVKVCISDSTRTNVEGGIYECNIYQRGTDIIADLQKIMTVTDERGNMSGNMTRKVAAFYSPQGGCGKTTLAYCCAVLGAKNSTAAYLNLEEFSYTKQLYETEFDRDMESVMFTLKDGGDAAAGVSDAVKRNEHNVYVMPELKTVGDFREMSGENVEKLAEQLQKVTGCSFLILDLSGELNERNRKVLELSDVSFWVFSDDETGRGKLDRVRNDQSIEGMNAFGKTYFLLNKCREKSQDASAVRIPFSESLSKGTDVGTVLSANQDFYRKCMDVLDLIELS